MSEYKIPQKIKDDVNLHFLEQLHEELHCIFGITLDMFEMNEIFERESTAGFAVALMNACKKCKKIDLITYVESLTWEENDLFDDFLIDRMREEKMILPYDEEKEIEKQLNVPELEVYQCIDCRKFYRKEDVRQIIDEETNEPVSACQCKNCLNEKEVQPLKINRKRAILDHLKYSENDFFQCSSCGKYVLDKWRKGTVCHHCDILSHSLDKNRNSYYLRARTNSLKWMNNI